VSQLLYSTSGVSPLLQEAPAPCQVKAAAAHKLVFAQGRGGALLVPEMAVDRDIDDLPRNAANYAALTPLWFLERAALAQPDRASVVHGAVRYTWADTYSRCRRLASALAHRSVGNGSTVRSTFSSPPSSPCLASRCARMAVLY
jgi:non-ribosomal peptide synthetase component F